MKNSNKRNELITLLRNENKSLRFIGERLGLTAERVRQIELILGLGKRGKRKNQLFPKPCANPKCKRVMKLPQNTFEARKYCSRRCHIKCVPRAPKLSKKEQRAAWNKRTTAYYHNVIKKRPNFHAWVKENNRKYAAKRNNLKNYVKKTTSGK